MAWVKIPVAAVQLDTSIQCRAQIDTATVNEYAERMTEGDKFPPIIVFGSADRCWIGDGWHRVLAARQISARKIDAELKRGNRVDALKHALQANAQHGQRRTNADKRRCVEIALREFPKLSSRAIGKMCGVGHTVVDQIRPIQVASDATSHRTGADGKIYPARRQEGSRPGERPRIPKDDLPETATAEPPAVGISVQMPRTPVNELPEAPEARRKGAQHEADPPRLDLDRALEEARSWMQRWGHLGMLAPVFDAITRIIEER